MQPAAARSVTKKRREEPMSFARLPTLGALLGLAFLTLTPVVAAQQVYKSVGADGRISFSDRLPVQPGGTPATSIPLAPAAAASPLPFELRQVAGKFPVTLYTGGNCIPCGSGRALLASRGIPFAERTVGTREDVEALQRLTGDNTLPMLTVGSQQIKGYSEGEWTQFLDAAGYPKTSALPPSFRQAPAAPLVAVERPAVPEPVAASGRDPAPVSRPVSRPPATPRGSNPAGILF